MHLAILMTNTDESAFADRHPRDGEKFTTFIHQARPGWTTEVFAVKDGVFPDQLGRFDGVMITGSPASVHTSAPWVTELLDLIRSMNDVGMPMFGACFGHQAIALALGGQVGRNPGGWAHGLIPMDLTDRPDWATALPDDLGLYGSHIEQVTVLPPAAHAYAASTGCPIAGFVMNQQVFTTQHHPEMTPGFIAALTDEMADTLGKDAPQVRASLAREADGAAFAEAVACFFEQAVSPAQPADPSP